MTDKQNKKKIVKEIQKKLNKLKEDFRKMELRPCHGDADLRQREKDLEILKQRIDALEKERDQYVYTR
jgi:chromosome segregation ATPase